MNIEQLYKDIAPRLTNWLVASGSGYHEACDLVQNTFLKIWKMRDDLRGDASAVSGLAFTIALNLRKNLVRDNARLSFVGEIRDPDENASGDDSGEVGDSAFMQAEISDDGAPGPASSDSEYLRRRLTEAFSRLPPVLREAYTLFQVGGRSIREIAMDTGVSENLVKVRIFRAKGKLREILSDLRVT